MFPKGRLSSQCLIIVGQLFVDGSDVLLVRGPGKLPFRLRPRSKMIGI